MCRADSINLKLPLGSAILGKSMILQSLTFMKQVRARRPCAGIAYHSGSSSRPEEFRRTSKPSLGEQLDFRSSAHDQGRLA
jgi:hypothetical protein